MRCPKTLEDALHEGTAAVLNIISKIDAKVLNLACNGNARIINFTEGKRSAFCFLADHNVNLAYLGICALVNPVTEMRIAMVLRMIKHTIIVSSLIYQHRMDFALILELYLQAITFLGNIS